jgi:hypothetical protein
MINHILASCIITMAGSVFGQSLLHNASTERVDVVMLGDSNQLFGGHGWDHGWAHALSNRVGLYGTGVHWFGENFGSGNGVGYRCNTSANAGAGVFNYAGWPGDPYDPSAMGLRPCNTLSLLNGTSLTSVGMTLHGNSPFYQPGDSLTGRVYLRTLNASAVLSPQFRLGTAPYTVYTQMPVISYTSTDMQQYTLSYTPSTNSNPLDFRVGNLTVSAYQVYYGHITNNNRNHGCAVSTLYGFGGQSARDLAGTLATLPDGFLIRYCDEIKSRTDKVVFRIYMGLNDRNETVPSYKRFYVGNSPEAYYDNLHYIVSVLVDAMENGATYKDYEIIITTPHPISNPNSQSLESYISLMSNKFYHPKVRLVHLSRLTSHTEMSNAGYYTSAVDTLHLSQAGYEELSRREIEAVLAQ